MLHRMCILAAAGILLISACSEPRRSERISTPPQDPVYKERAEKDAFFMSGDSPLLPQDKQGFHGLQYYPVDPSLKFSVRLHRYPAPAGVRLGTNTGEIRNGLRYGYFDFRVGGQDCRLQVYRLEEALNAGSSQLFIPFRDATSGHETYGAGRYIDLKENTSGVYDLDFNRAYNPSCAYNSQFSCPVPPAENTLKVPIRAGEKKYH
jgi:uncharacterized protein (DUF1684 family)